MPDFWPHFVSGEDVGEPWVDLFHIEHAHPSGGVNVPFMFFFKFDLLNRPTICLIFDKPCQIARPLLQNKMCGFG